MFSNVRGVLPQCNTRLRLLHLLYDINTCKTIKAGVHLIEGVCFIWGLPRVQVSLLRAATSQEIVREKFLQGQGSCIFSKE